MRNRETLTQSNHLLLLLHQVHNAPPAFSSGIPHILPPRLMRLPRQLLNLCIPPMLENLLDGDRAFSRREAIFQGAGDIFREIPTIIGTGRPREPIYLVDLFANDAPLFEAVCAVDGDCYVERGSGEGESANLSRKKYELASI